MTTFDEILPVIVSLLKEFPNADEIRPILINRDLHSRVRLILDKSWRGDSKARSTLEKISEKMSQLLGPHGFPPDRCLLFESDFQSVLAMEQKIEIPGLEGVFLVDRLISSSNWSDITTQVSQSPRVVFFSIKGGVGRSTALAAAAWSFAEMGKRVLVLDLDLESPGLSASLLPADRRPTYGIADWLVEDLVHNGDAVFNDMTNLSNLSENGEIIVAPAHGRDPGEYIAKLGRVWMPKVDALGQREIWSYRLARLLDQLEDRWKPDITLIDSRAGIDEVASACVTDLPNSTVLLFALDGDQTWSGFKILFRHWRQSGVVRLIRERLQVVGSMVPELGGSEYLHSLQERAWDVFSEELYDELPPGDLERETIWSFDQLDESAPHNPWPIRWNRGFAALKNIHNSLSYNDIQAVFGPWFQRLCEQEKML